jgi:hypothetical protein
MLFKYARNRACGNLGKVEWWERAGLLSEKEPRLNSEETEHLIYGRLMRFSRDCSNF